MRLCKRFSLLAGVITGIVGLAGPWIVQAQGTNASVPSKQSSTETAPTLRITTPLTILDVVVTDSKGHPVHGLKQSNFTILEDSKRMTPNSFEEHSLGQVPPSAFISTKPNLGTNVFTNFTPVPSKAGSLSVLLPDALNTPATGQEDVQRQILDYLKTIPNGTCMAVFRLSSDLSILQGFSTDPELLKAAITSKKNLPLNSILLAKGMGAEAALEGWSLNGKPPDSDRELANAFANTTASRVQGTLAAMNEIARYLFGMPGRKNLVWFTGPFPVNMELDVNYLDDLKTTAKLLASSRVAVYSIDARGQFNSQGEFGNTNFDPTVPPRGRFLVRTLDEHSTFDILSDQTGGKAFYNTDGLKEAVQESIDDGSNYYTLTYTPTNGKQDGKSRKLRVEVDQPGLRLTYRPSYDMGNPSSLRQVQNTGARSGVPRPDVMQTAMLPGALESTQILFTARIVPATSTENIFPVSNQPIGAMKPPYRRYAVVYAVDATNIAATATSDGIDHIAFEFVAKVYSATGDAINIVGNTVHTDLTSAKYQSMLKDGIHVHQEVDVPTSGEYFLRIGVRDFTSNNVGAMEIPLTNVQSESSLTTP